MNTVTASTYHMAKLQKMKLYNEADNSKQRKKVVGSF
jgi:hypothetical protein